MSTLTSSAHCFGAFHFDAEQRLLFRGDAVVPLSPKEADILAILLERRGRIVEKAELMRLVWPGITVEEIGLARNISLLRKALGEDAESQQFIETIPRRGYRFVAEELPSHDQSRGRSIDIGNSATPGASHSQRRWLAGTVLVAIAVAVIYWQFYRPSEFLPRSAGAVDVAVVPFTCGSPEIGCGEFSRNFEELLSTELAKQPSTRVVSPSTVARYQRASIPMNWMARILGLKVLAEGTVHKSGDRVIITARLGDVHSGKLIWADAYDLPAADLNRGESEAARAIANQIAAHLAHRQP